MPTGASEMPNQHVSIPEAPEYEPGYSQAVKAGNTVYVGGTMGIDAADKPNTTRNRAGFACRSRACRAGVLHGEFGELGADSGLG
jgi:enamine deaminase RidA (YjgF/YER057c/UK114 family)